MVSTSLDGQRDRIVLGKLWQAGLVAIIGAVIINLIIRTIGVALLNVPDSFGPLQVVPTVMFTAIGVLGAVIVFALLARFTHRPVRIFQIVALVVLLVSFIPDFFLLNNPMFPGATVPMIIVLLIEHVAAAAVAVWALTRFTRAS